MPFTLAHPAAAILLKNILGRYGVLSALIIGSLTPDFIYFLPLPFSRVQTHSLPALIWFCLPVGMFTWFLFQYFLKIPLYALMPHGFQKRLDYSKSHFLFGSHVIGVTISLITGAATHLLWDSFTHAGSPIVENSVALNFLLFEIMDYKVWLYKILQHGSTLLGITLLIYWTGCWYRKAKITQHNRKPLLENNIRWKVLMIILILPVLTGFWHGHALFSESITVKSIQILVGDTLRSGIALMVSGLFIYSLIFKCKKKL